jgi:hypothetical protein
MCSLSRDIVKKIILYSECLMDNIWRKFAGADKEKKGEI